MLITPFREIEKGRGLLGGESVAAMNKRRRKKTLKKDLRKLQRLLDDMAQEYKATAGQINQRESADYLAETEYFKDKLEITRAAVREMEARKCK